MDLLPIASFVKKDIWKMAKYLNIPDIINKKNLLQQDYGKIKLMKKNWVLAMMF